MIRPRSKNRRRRRRGSILAVSLMLVTLASVASVVMTRGLLDAQRLESRRRDLSKAFYMAEAGVAMVAHWSARPADYDADPNLFRRDGEGEFSRLLVALADGVYTIPENRLAALHTAYKAEAGRVGSIELLAPEPGDPAETLFRIRSVGQSPSGIERTVVYLAEADPVFDLKAPAPLVSFNKARLAGGARIHWGESWSKHDFTVPNKSQADYLNSASPDYDPWARFLTEGKLIFPSGWSWGAGRDLFWPDGIQPGLAPASGTYDETFFQNVPTDIMEWPDYAGLYSSLRTLALAHGRYYSTDASGRIYRDGIEDAAHRVVFSEEFGIDGDRSSAPNDFVFIDTIDGNPPAADGSNLATISVSGSSVALKGLYWIAANLDAGGVGSPSLLNAISPDGASHALEKIFLEGMLYAAGTLKLSGNAGIYGAAITQRGFAGGGSPDIYFDHRLAKGMTFPIASPIRLTLWNNY